MWDYTNDRGVGAGRKWCPRSTGAAIRKPVSASDAFIGSLHWTEPIGLMFSSLKNALATGYWAPNQRERQDPLRLHWRQSLPGAFRATRSTHGVSVNSGLPSMPEV